MSLDSHQFAHPRHRRGILGKWFGGEKSAIVPHPPAQRVQPAVHRVQTVNQQVPHYPIWKVHKYNGINLKPLPVSMVPQYQPVQSFRNAPAPPPPVQHQIPPQFIVQEKVPVPSGKFTEPIVVVEPTTKTEDDIKGIMKLLGISDPSQVPSIQEVMEMLGASTQEEAIETVKDIAATEEGIDLIKSFIESRQTPEDEGIIEVITQAPTTTTTTTTTTLPPPPPPTTPTVIIAEQPSHHFWQPNKILSSATAKVASRLDNIHTNTHLMNKILDAQHAPVESSSPFRNTLRNLGKFFTFQDNTPIPLEKFESHKTRPTSPKLSSPSVVYINEPIPAAPINLPALPKLSPLPELTGIRSIPAMPNMPQIQLPSHFSIPKNVVQGPYMRVKYPVASLAPLPMFRQRPIYSYRGQPIANAPAAPTSAFIRKSSYEVPLYGPSSTSRAAASASAAAQIPFSQSTREAFQNAPQIISSLPVPTLPYTFEDQQPQQAIQQVSEVDDQYFVAANTPFEAVALPGEAIQDEQQQNSDNNEQRTPEIIAKDDVDAAVRGPQRLSGYEAYATGKVHRATATNVDIVQSRLTSGSETSSSSNYADEDTNQGVVGVEQEEEEEISSGGGKDQ